MSNKNFFEESKEQSRIKAEIVEKYFSAWSDVIIATIKKSSNPSQKIAYLDIFAGQGRYNDNTKSTPLLILERAIANKDLRERLVTVFNDKDENNTKSLETAISQLSGINLLRYPPIVHNKEVGDEMVKSFESMKMIPTLFFVDPWGYKGLSLQLVNSVLKHWGCDCIFFFNYNRINMGLENNIVREHMNALFSEVRANHLRTRIEKPTTSERKALKPHQRETIIINEISQALSEGNRFVLPFRFKSEDTGRTSHYLIFVSKNLLGYNIMKDVMAKKSSSYQQGVPSFEYNPADKNKNKDQQSLFGPLDELEFLLLERFAGRKIEMKKIYEEHNVGTPYISKNYKDVLLKLEREGKIQAEPPHDKRRKDTFSDTVNVIFPKKL
jgi:three-Cys-motif partner protein